MNYKVTTIILLSSILVGCKYQPAQELTYTWMNEISFNYPAGWQVSEAPEQTLILSETPPFPVDMLFVFTYLKMYPGVSLEERIDQLSKSTSYKNFEVLGQTNIGDYTYTIVHLHSNYWDNHDTNFYLTEINGSTLEYEIGVNDNKIAVPLLESLKKID